MSTVHHADVIGSLLRPQYLLEARSALETGAIDTPAFKRIEDRAVDAAIAMQEAVGLDVVTDGELRRFSFFDHLLAEIDGLSPSEQAPSVTFHAPKEANDWDFQSPVIVTDRIASKRKVTIEEFAYARSVAHMPVKALLPSPLFLYTAWSPTQSSGAYRDAYELFADAARILREEIVELAAMGCTYVQIDSPDLGTLVDKENRDLREALGMPTERTLSEGMDLINSVADVPGVTFGLHLCRGNYEGTWISTGGYDPIAGAVFRRGTNFDVFLLEYDNERAGGFEPLSALPDDKVVVLGLVSTKTPELEALEQVVGRIEQAARVVDKERLAVSTQCGFSSVVIGANPIDEAAQQRKLKLVADAANAVWG